MINDSVPSIERHHNLSSGNGAPLPSAGAEAGQPPLSPGKLARTYRLHKMWGIVSMIVVVLLMTLSPTLLIAGVFIFASFAFLLMALEDSERQCTDAETRSARHEAAKIAVERENTDLTIENFNLIQSALRGEAESADGHNTARPSVGAILINAELMRRNRHLEEQIEGLRAIINSSRAVDALADNTERASANVIFINPRQPKGA